MGRIDINLVNKIAGLCKVSVSGEEEKLSGLFNETLKYIEILKEIDTSGIPATYQVTGLKNVFQEKNHNTGIAVMEALSNAPRRSNDLFSTEAVLDRKDG